MLGAAERRFNVLILYPSAGLFILVNAILLSRGNYYFLLFPLVPAILYSALFSPGRLFMAVVFLAPLSVELSRFAGELPFDISLPTEPLILVFLLVMLSGKLLNGSLNRKLLYHPLTLAVIFYLVWLVITTVTSTMPVVSLKFLLVRLGYVLMFYFLAVEIFRRRENIHGFLWCYIIGLSLVIIYTMYNHAGYGFLSQRAAHWVVRPFYNDHTAYGAALAMFIPVLLFAPLKRKWHTAVLVLVFIVALVFSYSRAAWLSVGAAFLIWLVITLRIRFATLVTFTIIAGGLVFMLRDDIVREMEKNRQDSSANFREHIRSMTNITSDASNLERINRWKAALAMYRERPVLGWGPGTYMFNYAPFQFSYDRTIISTNFADGGDTHSEYLGPLSETGLPGMLSFILVAAIALYTGFRLLIRLERRKDRLLVKGILLGLVTYLVHGTLNNFLHSDKAAIPFWGFLAVLAAMDLYGKKRAVSDKPAGENAGLKNRSKK